METENGKDRSSKSRKIGYIGNSENKPRIMGTASSSSAEYGLNEITASRENSQQRNTCIRGEQKAERITGKLKSQLITETEKQLAYYEEQAKILRERLEELNNLSEDDKDTEGIEKPE